MRYHPDTVDNPELCDQLVRYERARTLLTALMALAVVASLVLLILNVRANGESSQKLQDLIEAEKTENVNRAAYTEHAIQTLIRRQQGQIDAHDVKTKKMLQQVLDAILAELNAPQNREGKSRIIVIPETPTTVMVPRPAPGPSPRPRATCVRAGKSSHCK